jgi:hypothetical protein
MSEASMQPEFRSLRSTKRQPSADRSGSDCHGIGAVPHSRRLPLKCGTRDVAAAGIKGLAARLHQLTEELFSRAYAAFIQIRNIPN